jgi:hypothetical protein
MIEQFEDGSPDHKIITALDTNSARCPQTDELRKIVDEVKGFMTRLAASRQGIDVRVGDFKDSREALTYISRCGSPTTG